MNLDEHWIIAKIDTDGKPIIGDQLLIDGQAVFESLEQCLTALSTIGGLPGGCSPVRIPKSYRYLITFPEVPK